MFNLNIQQYNNDYVAKNTIDGNRLNKKIQIMEEAVINIIQNNFDTKYENIYNFYKCKMNALKEESKNLLRLMDSEIKKNILCK